MASATKYVEPNKTVGYAVVLARWCMDNHIAPRDAGQLVTLALRASKAGERECNTGQSADPARERFEQYARAIGFKTQWNGLWPTLEYENGARTLSLPAPE